jgi:hypothetical protein
MQVDRSFRGLISRRRLADWNKSKDTPGFRLEGIIEKSQAEK